MTDNEKEVQQNNFITSDMQLFNKIISSVGENQECQIKISSLPIQLVVLVDTRDNNSVN